MHRVHNWNHCNPVSPWDIALFLVPSSARILGSAGHVIWIYHREYELEYQSPTVNGLREYFFAPLPFGQKIEMLPIRLSPYIGLSDRAVHSPQRSCRSQWTTNGLEEEFKRGTKYGTLYMKFLLSFTLTLFSSSVYPMVRSLCSVYACIKTSVEITCRWKRG